MNNSCVLSLSCADKPGLVAQVAGFLAAHGGNITDAEQYNDPETQRFFMRVEFNSGSASADALRVAFAPIAAANGMDWKLRSPGYRPKVLLMVSKFDHCLVDLLYRERIGEIAMDVVAVVSNHERGPDKDGGSAGMLEGAPYFHCPVTRDTKPQQEAKVRSIIEESGAELIVLARYMQILSDEMAGYLSGRCINIHHSFLPGFKGAKPYHQAHARGVKMIGATSHYVTTDLDEGPIIAQDVVAIGHRESAEELVAKGRDVERRVLARAVKAHLEDRVFLNGARTVVFAR
ncbi:MAG: formyltetrahydrofolate deformylase [Novosphingobium sp.]